MPTAAQGTAAVSAQSGHEVPHRGSAAVDDSFGGLVRLFLSTVLPDCSVRGIVGGVAVGIAVGFAVVVISGVIRKAPSSPFRCDDPSLQAPQEKDILPTAPYVAVLGASSHAVVFVNEMWRPGASWTDATYWAARHLRRLFIGFIVSGVPSVFGSGERSEYRHVGAWAPPTGEVRNYRCTGPKSRKSGNSFPSGHATAAGFAGVFMFVYGIRRFVGFDQPCRAALLAVDLGALVLLVCLQRVLQHQHFSLDVVCGSAFGAVVAVVIVTWPYGDAKR
ncbi:uncharacterized protein LOC119372436 [Rhipicephalus sanguineus]|uniref:uncharacterized protein LOC119372436 n=1 Tax=Rhipicephalus sanguineus TaxID=34632 RepID=UPI001894B274|nr:uncharacterized protein LOC119372436 [Rhipicephalus sanguineus]XP_037498843.1 uncharacterized protein LOC119372436 [Rhipicephalus sanguineus]